jgi:drug/metabolite transporter (DMT)-like permease
MGGGAALPALAVVACAVLWGLWWLPLRWLAERGLPGDWASLVIFAIGAGVLVPVAWARRRRLYAGGWTLLLCGLLLGVVLVLWNHAILVGQVMRVVLLFYLAPVWATLLAIFVLKTRVGPLRALTVILGLTGAAIILGVEEGLPLPRSEGDWLGLISGLLFAVSATLARDSEEVAGLEKTFVAFAAAALTAFLLVAFGASPPTTGRLVLEGLPLAFVIAVFFVLPATWPVLWAASKLEPGRVSILLLLEVVVASISSSLLTDEPFGWREGAGCVLIILAGVTEALPELRARRVKEP